MRHVSPASVAVGEATTEALPRAGAGGARGVVAQFVRCRPAPA
jgi:hypothetical protein